MVKFFAEIFGYSSRENEIDTHRTVQIGSTEIIIPDIIIKNSESDLFIAVRQKLFHIHLHQISHLQNNRTRVTM